MPDDPRIEPDDTATWPPLDALRPGFDAGRAPCTAALAGRTITAAFDDGGSVRHTFFDTTRMTWEFLDGSGAHGDEDYEAFEVADELYYAQFRHRDLPGTAVALVADLRAGRTLAVVSEIGAGTSGRPACTQQFRPGVIDGLTVSGQQPAPSTDLVGRRVLWAYSDEHAYEHLYLSGHAYTWQCLAGPERGLADTDACTTYRIRPGIYLFAWREKVVPCAAVTVADHTRMRSHGALFGRTGPGAATAGTTAHFTFGGHGRLLGATCYPDRYNPAATGGRAR